MLTTSARLLRLLSMLQTRRHWPARELGERLGGGYSMRPGSSMPPVLLEDDEAVAVAVALRAAAGSVGQMDEAALGVLAKIDQVMPARLRKRASALHSITVSMPGGRDVPKANTLMQIAGACRDHKLLTLDYRDRQD